MKIWKYELRVDDRLTVIMPRGARILSVGVQGKTICLWAMVNPETAEQELRIIAIYGTGNPLPEDPGTFIGTVQTPPFVWHVFEVPA